MNQKSILMVLIMALMTLDLCASAFPRYNYGYGAQNTASASVLLEEIKALTFVAGRDTTARRTHPVPQLRCVGGSAASRSDLHPNTVQCRNVGSDGNSVQWKCEADLSNKVKFGATTVSCEGYMDSSDPNVLRGSCGLEYSLDFSGDYSRRPSNRPYREYDANSNSRGFNEISWLSLTNATDNVGDGSSWIGTIFTFAVLSFILYGFMKTCTSLFGGAAGSSHGTAYSGQDSGYGYNSDHGSYGTDQSVPSARPSWTPGFWSGVGGGSALGYMLANSRRSYYHQPHHSPYNTSVYNSYPEYHSSPTYRDDSDDTRTATAFASTNNR